MEKNQDAFRTIGEVAEELDLPQHVLRFWETKFSQIRPVKRAGGRRYYRPEDVRLVAAIRVLLYSEGYTIRGVQRILREQGARAVVAASQSGSPTAGRAAPAFDPAEDLADDSADTDLAAPLAGDQPSLFAPPMQRRAENIADGRDDSDDASSWLSPQDRQSLENALRELAECAQLLKDAGPAE